MLPHQFDQGTNFAGAMLEQIQRSSTRIRCAETEFPVSKTATSL